MKAENEPSARHGYQFHFMRVLLLQSSTGKLATTTGWTANAAKALNFGTTIRAIQHALKLHYFDGFELLYDFGDPRYDIRVALGAGTAS